MRTIRLMISKTMLDMFADAISEFTKKTKRFQSFRSTVQEACARARLTTINSESLETFCALHPVDGDILVWLKVSAAWKDDYLAIKEKLARISQVRVTDGLTIAFVIHHALEQQLITQAE